MAPSGLRTATDQFDGPRIITPSRTAWPPIAVLMRKTALAALGLRPLEPALEALDAPTGVDQLLLARVERVTVRADLHVELGLRRPRLELVAAGAAHGRQDVLGM